VAAASPHQFIAFGNLLAKNRGMAAPFTPPAPAGRAARGVPSVDADRVAALRGFNRFYTRRIGVLHERLPGGSFSLAESRVLWELAHLPAGLPGISAAALARTLELDPGYLSRLLKAMKQRKLLRQQPSAVDGRQQLLSLSAAGRRAFAPVDAGSQPQMAEVLA